MGVVTAYRRDRDPAELDDDTLQLMVDAVGVAIVRDDPEMDAGGQQHWPVRARLHQATGMVVAQLRLSPDDAYALLRAHAFAAGQTLATVVDAVLSRRLDFTTTDTDPGGSPR